MTPLGAPQHALNNLLGKIMAAAELALDTSTDARARDELTMIMRLVEEAANLVGDTAARAAEHPAPDA